jgi:hypothetical protein
MDTVVRPEFATLDRAACLALLARNRVGRVAFTDGPLVDVHPVHYVMRDDWIYGRTSPGTKLDAIRHNWRVAFEVDEVEQLWEWRSVVVHGGFYRLTPEGPPVDVARWQTALDAVRALVPETLTEHDPVPFRTVLFAIAMQEVTGRMATTRRAG